MPVIKIVPMPGPGGEGKILESTNSPLVNTSSVDYFGDHAYQISSIDENKYFIIDSGNSEIVRINLEADSPFQIGSSIKFFVLNSSFYIYTNNNGEVLIYADGQSGTNWWYLNGQQTGTYTLTKIGSNKWILSGPNILQD